MSGGNRYRCEGRCFLPELANNIGVMECKSYGGVRIYHEKVYIYINDNKIYCLELLTVEDNWDNIKEIAQVLEQSLEFFPEN
jgi:hypothetical protein